jgi:amino acid adenylation domain-containing protein
MASQVEPPTRIVADSARVDEQAAGLIAWQQALAGLEGPTYLVRDTPGPVRECEMSKFDCLVENRGLAELAAQRGIGLDILAQSVWGILLSRLLASNDVVFGLSVRASVNAADVKSNIVPVRLKVYPGESLLNLLLTLKTQHLQLSPYYHLPLNCVEQIAGFSKLFDTLIAFEPRNVEDLADEAPQCCVAVVVEEADPVRLRFFYLSNLFSRHAVELMASRFVRLLSSAVADPTQQLWQLNILAPEERRQILHDWNQNQHEVPQSTLAALIEIQVARTPNASALIVQHEELTYAELNQRANRLAHLLIRRGAGPESLVGVALPRTTDLLVALLAVLKAGSAYVPLDPKYPRVRLSWMFADAFPILVLTNEALRSGLPPDWSSQLLSMDSAELKFLLEHAPSHNPADNDRISPLLPQHPAYLIYTSGSTGKPKGAVIQHQSAVTLAAWAGGVFTPEEWSGVLASTSISFDLSIFELFATLIHGGTVILADSALDLATLPHKHKLRLINTVPSAAKSLLEMAAIPSGVRTINLAGEALKNSLVQGLYETNHVQRVYNLYGPSEDTTYSTFSLCQPGDHSDVTIGVPIWNTKAYVLDSMLEPVPIGVTGELYLAGDGLARGYQRQPGLTAERFVPDPHGVPGDRMYCTGDLVRWRDDGTLEYLGRADDQIKIRGFRIELREIEAVLASHPDVGQAVVLAREDRPNEKQLVAYVMATRGTTTVLADLRRYLNERLPEYMVPAAIMELTSFPQTANGKLDKHALPPPEFAVASDRAPRNSEEERLAAIFGDVLQLRHIGIDDNFFEMGGHSLLVIRLISRVRAAFGVELPLTSLFGAPTVAQLARCLEDASPSRPALQRHPHLQNIPLSYAQQRLWFVCGFEAEKALYNVPVALRLMGNLRVNALEQALHEIVRRHEVLRSHLKEVEGGAVQLIEESVEVKLRVAELEIQKGGGAEEVEKAIQRWTEEESSGAFDLQRAPLLRAALMKVKPEDHVLVLTLHHIVSDGWSLEILARELKALYEAYVQGGESPLPELPIQYADYAVWQREWLRGEVEEKQLEYWRKQLADLPPELELPGRRGAETGLANAEGAEYRFALPAGLAAELRRQSSQRGVTLYMTLLASFQLLLHRYSGESDVMVASPIAGRSRSETEGLIGLFVNTLFLRTDFSGNPKFAELLRQVRTSALEAYENQDLPLDRIVEKLQPERSAAGTSLVRIMFDLRQDELAEWKMGGLQVTAGEVYGGRAKFDLYLYFSQKGQRLDGVIEYRRRAISTEAVERMAGHIQELLQQIAFQPDLRVGEMHLATAWERQQLLVEFNRTDAPYESDRCVHELFQSQVLRTPEATAISFADQQLTYRELNQKANQLAHYLRKQGVGPESLVGICVERSLEMVIGILGILKAGSAYLPLDPEQPQERLAYMIQEAGTNILLSQKRWLNTWPGIFVVYLDEDWRHIAEESPENLKSYTTPENLAYVMFTSGSTGRPKGSAIVHRAIVRLVRHVTYAELGSQQVILQFAPVSFDASTLEIWGSLLNGGRLEIMDAGMPSFEALAEAIEKRCVNTLWLTAGLFHQMVELQMGALKGVKQLLSGGDVLSPVHVKKFLEANREVCLTNAYGPTENTTFTSCHPMRGQFKERTVPIGRPVTNTQVYVLDSYGQPVPIGVTGELYTGGDGLARGYVKRPDLTAERFQPNPFSENGGERLYRTGDLVRYQEDGVLEFVGRNDQQVKIRGFRIEPQEIERVMHEHAAVRDAAVVLRRDQNEKVLVAYVVLEGLNKDQLRRFLKTRLPAYMVPAHFVEMDRLPLTPNGKLDRKALPEPEKIATDQGYVPPRSTVEEMLANIWAELLSVPRVGRNDNFFHLGGHSLAAMQMMSRVRRIFNLDLAVHRLFEHPTLAGLAEQISAELMQGERLPISHLTRERRQGELPLSYAQQRLWFLYEFEADKALYNIPVRLRVKGKLEVKALEQALNKIMQRHEVLRSRVAEVEGRAIQVIEEAVELKLRVEELAGEQEAGAGESVQRWIEEEISRSFDLRQGPMLRARVLKVKEAEHVLLVTLHHIAADGWSLGVLAREMKELYAGYVQGKESLLPELPIQYADYAVWQREWLKGGVEKEQLGYWREQLRGMSGVLELPGAGGRAAMGHEGGIHRFSLSAQLVKGMKELGRKAGVTQFMTLLAGLQVVLSRYSGERDIAVGTPLAGRTREETEGLIGFFVNTVVLRTEVGGEQSFEELLKGVRETALGAYVHQDIPFEKLVEELQVEREGGRSPLFQVMCVMLNDEMKARWELRGLEVEEEVVELGREKFDLTVQFVERGGKIEGEISYRRALYERGMVERLARHLGVLLERVVEDEGKRIREQELLTEGEREQILVKWNQTGVEYGRERCIHELFEEQVKKTPEAPALIFGNQELTYRDLNHRANQLAHYLRDLGITADSLIGICMDRSVEMVIGLLAILKAGGAYVPLDPNYPAERLTYMVRDSQVEVLLTQAALMEGSLLKILPANRLKTICIDREQNKINQYSSTNPGVWIAPENLAYMIYTSGSTGAAKGAMNHHGAIRNRLLWMQEAYCLKADDRVLQKTPFSFDVSVWEFFWPLMVGAVLVVARPEGHRDPNYLVDTIARHRITTIHFVPSMLEIFLQQPEAGRCPSLRRVICSGEALSPELSKKFFSQCHAELHNLYGPTEAAVDVTFWECRRGQMERSIPIGWPIANIQMHVLDDDLRPVPVGVVGEIHIAGEGLGRGYWNRPELTALKFIPNPFTNQGGQRMYRTGDKGRYREDGALEFLGRLDHQVKIRGFRVELGEIETVLAQHAEVAQAVVIMRDERPGLKQLVAYVVCAESASVSPAELRSYLNDRLPDYMVPAAIVRLPELPLMANGKLDRSALPAPEFSHRVSRSPRTPEEEIIAALFANVLGLEQVSIDDNFFQIGGHSMLAMLLVARVRSVLFLEVPVQVLFDKPAVADFANAIISYETKPGQTQKIARMIKQAQSNQC